MLFSISPSSPIPSIPPGDHYPHLLNLAMGVRVVTNALGRQSAKPKALIVVHLRVVDDAHMHLDHLSAGEIYIIKGGTRNMNGSAPNSLHRLMLCDAG